MEKDSYKPIDEKRFNLFSKLILLGILVASIPLSVMISQQQQNTQNYAQGIQQRAQPPITPSVFPTVTFAPNSEDMPSTPTLYCEPTTCSYEPALKLIPH